MVAVQLVRMSGRGGKAAELVRQAQSRTGGVVSTIVIFWLQVATCWQSSTACQVRVMMVGQTLLVTVLTTVSTTPLLGVPNGGAQALVQTGGVNDQGHPVFAISPDNYTQLYKNKDVDAYAAFFTQNYLPGE